MTDLLTPLTGEVHVWIQDLDRAWDHDALDDSERVRTRRFRQPLNRRRWAAGRAGLRSVLATYLGVPHPAQVPLLAPEGAAPLLADPTDLSFSRSTSGARAAVAVTRSGRVGIDVEGWHRSLPEGLADWLFHPSESAWIDAAPGGQGWRRFLETWTAKEAVAKAWGTGVASLRQVEIEPPLRVVAGPAGSAPGDWRLFGVEEVPDAVCTVAVWGAGERPRMRVFELHGRLDAWPAPVT